MATEQKAAPHLIFDRFTLSQRLEHLTLLLSFTILAITGLVQKFVGSPLAELSIRVMGGIETVRIIHHISAIVLLVLSAYHIIAVMHRVFVKRRAMTMLPGLGDVTDALDLVRYNLGLTKQHPKLPRYNFGEKFEYWALVWGTAVMAITGFILWNPVLTATLLPGQFIPTAKAAHGGEAILAVLAILVWHLYNVHIKMFNRSVFTGRMPRNQMKEEHAGELAQRDAGIERPLPSEEAMRRRERIFLPVALLLAAVSALAIYWFATYETTAIATVPPAEGQAEVFTPLTPTPIASPTVDNNQLGAPIPHPIEGQAQCDTCHAAGGLKPYPADHVDRPNESCQVCHEVRGFASPGAPAAGGETASIAVAIPHAVAGKEQCSACHGDSASLAPMPAGHIRPVQDATCTLCHKPAPAAAGGAATAEPAAGGPKPIPHPIEGDAYKDCTTCHGAGKLKPFPENHAGFAADSCTTCHQPAAATPEAATAATPEATAAPTEESAGASAGGPKPIPHSIVEAAYQDCTVCHGAGKLKPFPASHEAFPVSTCAGCHQPMAEATPEAAAEPTVEPTAEQ